MIYQEILDRITDLRNELLKLDRNTPTSMPMVSQYTFHKMLELMQEMAQKSRDLEEWNHQAWAQSAYLQTKLKDPR